MKAEDFPRRLRKTGRQRSRVGLGLMGMKERMRHLGGHFEIKSDSHGSYNPGKLAAPGGCPMKSVRILVADDHEVVRHGLRRLLEAQPGWEICGEAATGREAVEKAKQLKPDIVVLDYSMPELNGTEATRQIIKEVPRTEVLILTMHGSEQLMRGALEAGARGYVLKSDASRDLISAVHALIEHKPFLSSSASGPVLDKYLKTPQEPASQQALTPANARSFSWSPRVGATRKLP